MPVRRVTRRARKRFASRACNGQAPALVGRRAPNTMPASPASTGSHTSGRSWGSRLASASQNATTSASAAASPAAHAAPNPRRARSRPWRRGRLRSVHSRRSNRCRPRWLGSRRAPDRGPTPAPRLRRARGRSRRRAPVRSRLNRKEPAASNRGAIPKHSVNSERVRRRRDGPTPTVGGVLTSQEVNRSIAQTRRERGTIAGLACWLLFVVASIVWPAVAPLDALAGIGAAPFYGLWEWHAQGWLALTCLTGAVVIAFGPPAIARLPARWVPAATGAAATAWVTVVAASDGWSRLGAPLFGRHQYLPFAVADRSRRLPRHVRPTAPSTCRPT